LTHRQQALLTKFGIKSPALRASADGFASQRDSGGAPRVSPAGDPTVYAPRQGNDRLLLGLKGSLNEYELDLLRQRSLSARYDTNGGNL
jgi:hypothetical protein